MLLLVHGYNTSLADAHRAYDQIARRLNEECPATYDRVLGFT